MESPNSCTSSARKRSSSSWSLEARTSTVATNEDKPPIHCRVKQRRPDLIPGLIALGGDINARDNTDQTPLFGAVERLDAPEVEQMIQWGADPTLDAHSKIYGDYTLTKYALSWYNLF